MNQWRYYNHALISNLAPHEIPDTALLADKNTWNAAGKGYPLLARWTTSFDCGQETNWWYVIKDTPFDLQSVKAKRRYEVNKGIKNFDVRVIDPREYRLELYHVQIKAFSAYPEKYRPSVNREKFLQDIDKWSDYVVFGAFSRESGMLCGYAILERNGERYVKFSVQKTMPEQEKYGLNAALVFGILQHYADFLEKGGYICDGERSINHETAFQDYLEKYFEFRKAYCILNVRYRPGLGWMVKLLYLFRKVLLRFDHVGLVHNINAVLRMETISRKYSE